MAWSRGIEKCAIGDLCYASRQVRALPLISCPLPKSGLGWGVGRGCYFGRARAFLLAGRDTTIHLGSQRIVQGCAPLAPEGSLTDLELYRNWFPAMELGINDSPNCELNLIYGLPDKALEKYTTGRVEGYWSGCPNPFCVLWLKTDIKAEVDYQITTSSL